jgi:tetratricopeptide (TPR) repeat protein
MRRHPRVRALTLLPLLAAGACAYAAQPPVTAASASSGPAPAASATPVPAPADSGSNAAPVVAAPVVAAPIVASPGDAAARAPADPAKLAERDIAYRAFREQFESGRYAAALPNAERVVDLTEQASDPLQLPSALNNLGATHYKLGDYVAAEKAYARALQLVEEQAGAASQRLLAPLRGLALTYQSGGRQDAATPLLERAVSISRRSEGLFNPAQLSLIEPLIEGYVATGRLQDADQMHRYAFRIDERRYGPTSVKMVPSIQRLAGWFERTQRYTQARSMWARSYTVSAQRGQENLTAQVNALRGMARTYRLEYQYGPEFIEETFPGNGAGQIGLSFDGAERDAFGRRLTTGGTNDYRLDPQGREFLEAALKIIDSTTSPSPQARATLLVELGDWHSLSDRDGKAQPYYQQAWELLPRGDPGSPEALRNPLLYPSPLLYRPPVAARRLRDLPADAVTERVAIAEFTVGTDGKVRDAKIVEGDATEAQRSSFLTAISRAVYRPRFVDGKPVVTEQVRFRETFREQKRPVETTTTAHAGG